MEERTAFFQSEVTVDAAYLRRTWSNYGKLARARWILALFPLICIIYLAAQHARGGYTSLGIFALAVILLLFAVALPRLVVGQMLGERRGPGGRIKKADRGGTHFIGPAPVCF